MVIQGSHKSQISVRVRAALLGFVIGRMSGGVNLNPGYTLSCRAHPMGNGWTDYEHLTY